MDLNLKLDEAIRACCLSETLTRQRLHYFVKKSVLVTNALSVICLGHTIYLEREQSSL